MATAAFSGLYESIRPVVAQEAGIVSAHCAHYAWIHNLLRTMRRRAATMMILAALFALGAHFAAAQESMQYSFGATSTDAKNPDSNLIFDSKGNLYGTSLSGGAHGYGTVFELSPGTGGVWTETVLYSFGGELASDAGGPGYGLVFDAQGNLYGVTTSGGVYGYGAVFELSPHSGGAWTEKVVYSFNFSTADGSSPVGSLAIDGSGNLYGAGSAGGTHFNGAIFKLSPGTGGAWTESVLYNFAVGDAAYPQAGPVFDKSGNLFGTTYNGGANNGGAVYELSPGSGGSWTEKVIHSFPVNSASDGWEANSSLIFDSAGNLYGTTSTGGHQFGTVFEMTPQAGGTWTEKLIYNFNPTDANPDGEKPTGNLVFDSKGNLYGATFFSEGGAYSGFGLIYKLTPQADGSWTRLILHDFTGNYTPTDIAMDGVNPKGGLVMNASGTIYGTTDSGGVNAYGAFFILGTESAVIAPVFSPVGGTYGSPQTVTLTDATPGSTIYYSNNGTPDTTSTVYTGPFTVSTSQNVAAFATAPGLIHSSYPLARYVITPPTAKPVISPGTGTYTTPQTVTITDGTSGATIYYTINGTAPTTSSTKYTGAITVSATETIEAFAVSTGRSNSAVASAIYTFAAPTAATPVFSPAVGTYTSAQSVTITDSTAGATIYYTTNGTTPTASSTKYTGPIAVATSETIRAIAVATGYSNSAVASGTYTIQAVAATPVFSVPAGTYATAQSIAITDATAGASIYYTVNGTAPSALSTLYTGPITVAANETLEAIAIASGFSQSATATAAYVISNAPPSKLKILHNFIANGTDGLGPQSALVSDAHGNLFGTTYSGGAHGQGSIFELSPPSVSGGAWTESILYSFPGGEGGPGRNPTGTLVLDKNGNLYGTAAGGNDQGLAFELAAPATAGGAWTQTVLHMFSNTPDGSGPIAGLVFDTNGNLYGTTEDGGTTGDGAVFKLTPASGGTWISQIIFSFNAGASGNRPLASLIFDSKGNLYGTAENGGANDAGVAFELSPPGSGTQWSETVLHNFGGSLYDGSTPVGNLIFDAAGNLYGTTETGYLGAAGVAFKLTPPSSGTLWTETILHAFANTTSDGGAPESGLVFDAAGNLYGTTIFGGNAINFTTGGTIFELSPPATSGGLWTESTIYKFAASATDAYETTASLIIDKSGNLFGTTQAGGTSGLGTVFEFSTGVASTTTVATPVFSPAGGSYSAPQSVTISDATAGATIYYTINGAVPTTASTKYIGAFLVTATETVQAIAVATGYNNSAVASATYTIGQAVATTPIFSPVAGTYTTAQSITISDTTAAATIYYTTNGGTPTASSTKYAGAIAVATTETIKAIAVAAGYTNSAVASATYTIKPSTTGALQFVAVTPCRIADTRNATGPFGGPELAANSTRIFNIPQSGCNIPATAVAYSLNATVVPNGTLGYITVYPAGVAQPLVSTLNSDGRVKANATITPAGTNGGVSVFASDATQFILDIDGYFVPAGTSASGLQFFPVTPCRIADTRNANGPLGGPSLAANTSRAFPVQSSTCGIPATAKAYSLNVTAVPHGGLGFLTAWPSGQPQPVVSTLNSSTGAVTANAAIVPAGTGGAVSIFVSDASDVILDVDGYFAAPAAGGLSLYTVTPCRAIDTRNGAGAFNGTLTVPVHGSVCAPPATAQAYVLNATVVPSAGLSYLSLWAAGASQPLVSTLNANDAAVTSNMAIVPTSNGSIDAFASDSTQLILDISSYFAP